MNILELNKARENVVEILDKHTIRYKQVDSVESIELYKYWSNILSAINAKIYRLIMDEFNTKTN